MKIKSIIFSVREKILRILGRLGKKGEVFYINGPEVLPPPLSREEENKIIMRLEHTALVNMGDVAVKIIGDLLHRSEIDCSPNSVNKCL